ncbi:hypothetical protein ACE1CI_23360 [Aerosakkonemataceae cyanobacterium BLCC-F50]|uniref:ATP synthase F0 subunit 8 n=1 Tax=Floridaenema flaviceps BLCC-F50 TaxID=3153642 RepID=A0ABV4XVU8_9CYAN
MGYPTPIDTAPYQTINSTNLPSNQWSSTNSVTVTQVSSFIFFLLILLIGYFCLQRWTQKRCKQQAIDYHQQKIEQLERIWKMTAHRKL